MKTQQHHSRASLRWWMVILALLAWLPGMRSQAVETLMRFGQPPKSVVFLGYDRGQLVYREEGSNPQRMPLARIQALGCSTPVEVLVRFRDGRRLDRVQFSGFTNANFVFHEKGQERRHLSRDVVEIQVPLTASRWQVPVAEDEGDVISRGEEVDIPALLEPGRAAVIHVHSASSISSRRAGLHAARLVRDSKGRVQLYRIALQGAGDPVARQYDIQTVPQFWFYNRMGQRVVKLTTVFTENAIEDAFREIDPSSFRRR